MPRKKSSSPTKLLDASICISKQKFLPVAVNVCVQPTARKPSGEQKWKKIFRLEPKCLARRRARTERNNSQQFLRPKFNNLTA